MTSGARLGPWPPQAAPGAAATAITGWVMASVALGAPFVLGGALKIVYDVLLYGTFKDAEPKNLE